MALVVMKQGRGDSRRHVLGEEYGSSREEGELAEGMSSEGSMALIGRK